MRDEYDFSEGIKNPYTRPQKSTITIRLDKVTVDWYGTPTPINQTANISVQEGRCLVIAPWDASLIKGIEKALQVSNIGITPTNDGKVIRLVFPQLTEERRKELCKQAAKYADECKVAIRNIRREANDKSKEMKKNSEMTEDEQKSSDKAVQELTDKYIKNVDAVLEKKNAEIMAI